MGKNRAKTTLDRQKQAKKAQISVKNSEISERQAIFSMTFGAICVLVGIFSFVFGFGLDFGLVFSLVFGFGWIFFVLGLVSLIDRHYRVEKIDIVLSDLPGQPGSGPQGRDLVNI